MGRVDELRAGNHLRIDRGDWNAYDSEPESGAAKEPTEEKKTEPLPVNPENEAEAMARMEAFHLQGIKIEDEELRLLALDRANTVLGYLIDPGKVEPGRLFVIEPHLARPEGEEAQESQTEVELLLK
jgi:hypothetical protein